MKKKALFTSIVTIALCLSLIAGSTFALFTSESKVNIAVTAGNVEVKATIADMKLHSPAAIDMNGVITDNTNAADNVAKTFANGGTAELDGNKLVLSKMTPGDKVDIDIAIENKSNVAISFRAIAECSKDGGLFEGLNVYFNTEKVEGRSITRWENWSDYAKHYGTDGKVNAYLTIELPADAGNKYQETSCELTFTVEAVQGNAEMPDEWDGKTVEAPKQDDEGVYHITNSAEFAQYISELNNDPSHKEHRYDGANVVLDRDIDLGGYTIEVSGEGYAYGGSFDGQGHTVSNYVIKRTDGKTYTGLFSCYENSGASIKNLTVKNGTVISNGAQVSAIMPSLNTTSGVVDNCHAYNCTVIGEKKVGVITGYVDNGTVSNCTATDCTVYASDNRADQASVFGYANGGSTFTNNTATNVTVKYGVTAYIGGNVNLTTGEKVAYVANATVTAAALDDSPNYKRIYSDNAVFVNCTFEGDGNLWIKDTATFIDCTFNTEIHDAEPVVGTVTFENCTFNKPVHFAPASTGADETGKYFVAEGCTFNANLTVSGFEKATLKDCTLSGNNWAGKNMISYSPLVVDNCTFTTGIRLGYSDLSKVTCTNSGVVDVAWYDANTNATATGTVGSN